MISFADIASIIIIIDRYNAAPALWYFIHHPIVEEQTYDYKRIHHHRQGLTT